MSRRPTSTRSKLLAGVPGRHGMNHEPIPAAGRPDCPPELNARAREEWEKIVPQLEAIGLLAKTDAAALELFCQHKALWQEAIAKIGESGLVVRTKSGAIIPNPFLLIANRQASIVHRYLCEFGLSPAARSKTQPAAVADPESNRKDRFVS